MAALWSLQLKCEIMSCIALQFIVCDVTDHTADMFSQASL